MPAHVVARDAAVFALVVDVEQLPAAGAAEEERIRPDELERVPLGGLWLAVIAMPACAPSRRTPN